VVEPLVPDVEARRMTEREPFVDVRAVAAHLSVGVGWVYRKAATGEIPSYQVGGHRRFRIGEIEATLTRRDPISGAATELRR
jgi:excisionase family DNA binding protein